jgi:hypothetical protein
VLWSDPQNCRPGLPDQVAALVEEVSSRHTTIRLVNLDATNTRTVEVSGGSYGEHPIVAVSYDEYSGDYPGDSRRFSAPGGETTERRADVSVQLNVRIPARRQIRLRLEHDLFGRRPQHKAPRRTTVDEQ